MIYDLLFSIAHALSVPRSLYARCAIVAGVRQELNFLYSSQQLITVFLLLLQYVSELLLQDALRAILSRPYHANNEEERYAY